MKMTTYGELYYFLMLELHLMHKPVGITCVYDEAELAEFRRSREYKVPLKPLTLCQAELGARMAGEIVLLENKKLWCTDARCCFAFDEISDGIVKDLCKFSTDEPQARRMAESKPKLPKAPLALLLCPLDKQVGEPDVVHFCCDNMQAYHLVDDWMAVRDVYPFRPAMSVNSAVCGGTVFSIVNDQANMTLACAGSYNSGKMERGEINVMIPGHDIFAVVQRMADRMETTGGVSLTRKGQQFPGADICQNCPIIHFVEDRQK